MISFLAEFPDIRNNGRPIVETPISIEAARAFNTVGAATLTIPDFIDRRSFRKNTRMRLWRRGLDGTATLFGDTNWFLRKISHNYTRQTYAIEFEDAISLLQHRRVAYTSETPYADKTLEEFGLIVPNNSLRIDNMMRQYVRENYSTLALDAARNNLLITVEDDRNLAPYGEKEASWQVLGDVLNNLADMSAEKGLELFYDLVPQPDDSMIFKVWDKVRRVDRGSDSFNILTLSQNLNHLTDVEEVEDYTELGTYVYVLGYDSGPSQIIVEVSDEVEIDSDPFGRIEFTEAAPDVDRISVLEDYGQAALRGKRGRRRVSARVVEGAGIVYGRDYSYGDRVMIQVGTRKYNCHVKAVNTRWEAGVEDLDVRLEGYAGYERDAFPTFLLPGVSNQAPVVSAGANQEIADGETANLVGTASDDGLPDPPAALTYQWEKVSGPGIVTFGTPNALTTTADFDTFGTYVLRLSASDSVLISSDEMTMLVEGITTPPSFGLVEGVEEVAGIGSDGFIYRTSDFQTVSGSGGPTWDRVDTTIPGTRYSFVVDPFSPGYAPGATTGSIDGWIVNDTAIYRVTDLFGSVVATSVYTFAVPTVAASYHWRTIQASFGAFFDEGTNPWLLCTSYYGSTVGHTGTWVTRSLDGGVTWSAEVQVSADYDSEAAIHFNPIAVYTSPRTPGLAYTAAHTELVDDPTNPLPRWALWRNIPVASGLEVMGLNGSFSAEATAEEVGSQAGTAQTDVWMILAPPKDAARVVVVGTYVATRSMDGGSSSTAGSIGSISNSTNTTHTDDLSYTQPPSPDGTSSGTFTIEWTKSGVLDWHINSESLITSPPVVLQGCRLRLNAIANAAGGANPYASYQVELTLTVTEIELEGGYIYTPATGASDGFVATDWGASWVETALITPGQEQAGSIHIPWEDNTAETLIYFGNAVFSVNREFRLLKSDGGVITDISPTDTGIDFGVNHYGFAIRAYDSDRQFLALGGIGNDTSNDPVDDKVGLWVSSNAGTAWANILAPVAADNVLHGLQIAFSGDNSDVLFAWGGWSNAAALAAIYYSSDFGATLDSREGNINSLGTVAFIGIAGGPVSP